MQFGYWVDLQSVKLSDDNQSWMQLMPVGVYNHPIHGKITFSPDRFDAFKKNFDERVRGTDIDIDYDHKEDVSKGSAAAGWLRQLANRGADGLWGLVEWTETAVKAIKSGEFRYFSPEYVDEWTHPQTGVTHKDVLFGGGLTNRPFLKDILPVNMTEVFGHNQPDPHGGQMDVRKLAEALGVKIEDGQEPTEEGLLAAITSLNEKVNKPAPQPKVEDDKPDPELVKLSETNPVIAKMLKDQEETAKRLKELESSNRLNEVKLGVKSLHEVGANKGRSMGKAQSDLLEEVLFGVNTETGAKVTKLFTELYETGFVELGEKGERRTSTDGVNAIKKFDEAVAEKRKLNDKLSYADAATEVSRENPELWEARSEALFAGDGA